MCTLAERDENEVCPLIIRNLTLCSLQLFLLEAIVAVGNSDEKYELKGNYGTRKVSESLLCFCPDFVCGEIEI